MKRSRRRPSPSDRRHWTPDEAVRFLSARRDDPMLPIWRLALDSGIRRAELSELIWSEIDLDRGTVTIRNPKRRTARRVRLGQATVTALRALATRQPVDEFRAGDAWVGGTPGATGRLVVGPTGQSSRPTFLTIAFRHAQRGLDLPPIPFHGLRHTTARIAFTHGASIQAIAERLGHLDAATTLEVWPHLLDSDKGDEPEGESE